jgi:hypothetical protein
MSRYIPVLYKPKWQRVIINQQTGLLYKKYFLSDRAIQHIRDHSIYGPAKLGKSHFFLETEKLQAMKDIEANYDSLFRIKDVDYKIANLSILGNLARMADIMFGGAKDGRPLNQLTQKHGTNVQDARLYYDAHIGTGPVKEGEIYKTHEHTSDIRVVTRPMFISDEHDEVHPIITAFPVVTPPKSGNNDDM